MTPDGHAQRKMLGAAEDEPSIPSVKQSTRYNSTQKPQASVVSKKQSEEMQKQSAEKEKEKEKVADATQVAK